MSLKKPILRILLAAVLASVLLVAVLYTAGPATAAPLREQDMVPPEPLVSGARALSSSVIEILLPEMEYDIDNVADPGNYVITSTDDQGFTGGVEPDSVHHRYWPDNAWYNSSLSWDDPGDGKGDDICHINIVYRIYLRMPVPLTEGCTYSVTVDPAVVAAGPFTFTFDPQAPNKVIHANQVAYVASGPKVAYLCWWTGQGCISFDEATDFHLVDESTGLTAFSGEVVLDGYDRTWAGRHLFYAEDPEGNRRVVDEGDELEPGEILHEQPYGTDIHSMDFTSFSTEGTYHIYVPTVGSSYPFRISGAAFDDIGYTMARGLTLQRDGDHGLDDPDITHWNRPPAHLDDAIDEVTIAGETKDWYTEEELQTGARIDLAGGHMDAGDRGKYPHNSADVCASMLSTTLLFPEQVEGLGESLEIPESGNGIPDFIDELVFELDWLQKAVMNSNSDGTLPVLPQAQRHGLRAVLPRRGRDEPGLLQQGLRTGEVGDHVRIGSPRYGLQRPVTAEVPARLEARRVPLCRYQGV